MTRPRISQPSATYVASELSTTDYQLIADSLKKKLTRSYKLSAEDLQIIYRELNGASPTWTNIRKVATRLQIKVSHLQAKALAGLFREATGGGTYFVPINAQSLRAIDLLSAKTGLSRTLIVARALSQVLLHMQAAGKVGFDQRTKTPMFVEVATHMVSTFKPEWEVPLEERSVKVRRRTAREKEEPISEEE